MSPAPMVEATSIRAALDADGLPYSILVYAILAALQTLHAARLLGSRGGTGGGIKGGADTLVKDACISFFNLVILVFVTKPGEGGDNDKTCKRWR